MRRPVNVRSFLFLAAAVAVASCHKTEDVTTRTSAINVNAWSPHDGTAAPIPATTIGTARSQISSNNMAAALSSGQVLVAGGIAAGAASTSVHRLTTSTENSVFMAGTNLSGNARGFGGLIALNAAAASGNGEALQAGGGTRSAPGGGAISITAFSDANRWNAASNSWTPPGALSMTTFRYMPSATLMADGRVLIAGGHTGAGGGAHTNTETATLEYFNPANNTFSATGLPSLTTARRGHVGAFLTCVAPSPAACAAREGFVWFAGGLAGNGLPGGGVTSSELFNPAGAGSIAAGPGPLPLRMYAAAARLADGKILICGGCNDRDCTGASIATCTQYDPVNNTLNTGGAPGSMLTAAGAFSMITLPTGKVLAVGGYSGSSDSPLARSEVYDPVARTWSNTAGSLTDARYDAAVALLQDGKVIVAGGRQNTYAASTFINSVESFDPGTPTVDRTYTGAVANAVTRDGCKVWQADGTFVQLANGTACDDKNSCTSGETCQNGVCGAPTATITCTGGNQCKVCDPNPANAGAGQARCTINATNGTACNDGTFCNGADTCTAGACTTHVGNPCTGGAACNNSCNEAAGNCFNANTTACATDSNACTDDHCDGAGACAHTNNTAPCDDGVYCNGSDTCAGGACGHAGDPCATGAACNNSCNETAKNCFNAAASACTDDSNACTDDRCNGTGTCLHTNNTAPCDDGVFCNGVDTCSGGACGHAGDPCAGGAECSNSCNEAAGNCFVAASTACTSDSNVCTNDVCNGAGTCAHVNNTAACDDGNACTTGDACNGGSCAGNPVTCSASDSCHTAGTCNPTNGTCSNPAKTDGSGCDDGNGCTQTDMCLSGVCTGGNPMVCPTPDECHVIATCNVGTGSCPAAAAKADGTACSLGTCLAGVCTPISDAGTDGDASGAGGAGGAGGAAGAGGASGAGGAAGAGGTTGAAGAAGTTGTGGAAGAAGAGGTTGAAGAAGTTGTGGAAGAAGAGGRGGTTGAAGAAGTTGTGGAAGAAGAGGRGGTTGAAGAAGTTGAAGAAGTTGAAGAAGTTGSGGAGGQISGTGGRGGAGGGTGTGARDGGTDAAEGGTNTSAGGGGCGCELGGTSASLASTLSGLGIALVMTKRRRRRG